MPIPFPVIVEVANTIGTAYAERQHNARTMAAFSRLLAENNAVLIREIGQIVDQVLSETKLNDCTNKLATLSTFYTEYANNLDDHLKLSLIEQQCQFVLDTLDDPDINLAGVRTYLGVATLRINALALKSNFQPGDRENAKELAKNAISYALAIKPQMVEATEARVGPLLVRPNWTFWSGGRPGGVSSTSCTGSAFFTVDGVRAYAQSVIGTGNTREACTAYVVPRLRPAGERARSDKIAELVAQLPLAEVDACIAAWGVFTQGS